MACAHPPNQPSNTSRTRSDSPHRNSVPTANFASYPEWNVTVTSLCGFQATLIVAVSPTSSARSRAGFLPRWCSVTSVPITLSLPTPLRGDALRTTGGRSGRWWTCSVSSWLRQVMSLARSCNHPNLWLHLVPPSAGTHVSAGPDKPISP